ncbi:MAG: multicopper oxidase domain-containing protein [Burkholderiales bacterium]|nr:multicopper oxidase domain-containing protein [Burkholderiales bacterium]
MPSTLPEPMPFALLKRYRWVTPITPRGIPALALPASGVTDMYIGTTSVPHVFADSPDGGITPPISQTMWGYGSSPGDIRHPGPTLVAQSQVANQVRWNNLLPEGVHHPFVQPPVDARLGGMEGRYRVGHASVHLHGGHLHWASDGHPVRRAGTAALLRPQTRSTPNSVLFEYPNTQQGGALLWYHDHVMDMTSMNVYSGLAGGYVLRDPGEAGIAELPSGDFEMPLIIQDRSFAAAPTGVGEPWMLYGHAPYLRDRIAKAAAPGDRQTLRDDIRALGAPMGEFKGDALCVNGKIWPHLDVEPRAYRFRMLNGCNTRMLVLRLSPEAAPGEPDVAAVAPGLSMLQIGGDSGFISPVVELKGELVNGEPATANLLVLASAERADVVIDFSALAGQTIYLSNHATKSSPLGNGGDLAKAVDPAALEQLQYAVLQFRVSNAVPQPLDRPALEAGLAAITQMPNWLPPALPTRRYVISEQGVALTPADAAFTVKAADRAYADAIAANPADLAAARQAFQDAMDSVRPPGRFGWNAITMQPSLTLPAEPGLLWAGPAPTPVGGPPAGGPYIDAENQPGSPVRHTLGGPVELWEFYNFSADVHPLHLHLASFQVLSRQEILSAELGRLGAVLPIDANETGWKDTVRVNAADPANPDAVGQVTRLLVHFDDGGDATRDYRGHFVFHCHLLEHEDMGMMRPLEVY